jgi:hypothetical protein
MSDLSNFVSVVCRALAGVNDAKEAKPSVLDVVLKAVPALITACTATSVSSHTPPSPQLVALDIELDCVRDKIAFLNQEREALEQRRAKLVETLATAKTCYAHECTGYLKLHALARDPLGSHALAGAFDPFKPDMSEDERIALAQQLHFRELAKTLLPVLPLERFGESLVNTALEVPFKMAQTYNPNGFTIYSKSF